VPEAVPIEAVIFDYGGVISVSPFERLAAAEERLGLRPGALAELLGYGIDIAEPAPGEPYTNKWHLLEIGAIELPEYADWVRERSAAVFGRTIDPGRGMSVDAMGIHWMVVQEIGRLRAEGYKLAICSNNIAAYREAWQRQFPIDWFDAVVDSSEVGVRKPDPAIYRLTAERLGVEPAACAFLDDHPGNVAGAIAAGMAGILVGDPWVAIADLRALLTARGPNGDAPGAPRSPAPAPPSS
jgi:putative hydrolase of the HAD superfamily